MAGRGELSEGYQHAHNEMINYLPPFREDGTEELKNSKFITAKDPLHNDKPGKNGIGPGLSFAQTFLKSDSTHLKSSWIGLVPSAWGGTKINRWEKGASDLYERTMAMALRAALARPSAKLGGIIWESDSDRTYQPDYERKLSALFKDMREDLTKIFGLPRIYLNGRVPIVVGEIPEFLNSSRFPDAPTVNNSIRNVSKFIGCSKCVSSKGLSHIGDNLHFDAESARELGRRFAVSMIEIYGTM
eukprot:UC4_evm2s608